MCVEMKSVIFLLGLTQFLRVEALKKAEGFLSLYSLCGHVL